MKENKDAKKDTGGTTQADDIKSNTQTNVAGLENKIKELEENWKRALADYINLQKRTSEEKLQAILFANEVLISKLLPTLDGLEKVETHLQDTGLSMVYRNMRQALEGAGLKEVEAQGKSFDPEMMEAVDVVEGEEGKVVEVLEKGYFLNEKLIRPARVRVGGGKK